MTNLDSILKSKDITLPTKVCVVKAMVFPVVLYGCESWTIKKAEHWRINAFFGAWRILKEINPEYSLEGQMLKLKLQYFGLMGRADLLEKTLMLGKNEGRRRRGQQRMRWLDSVTDSMDNESEQTPGDGEGEGSLESYSPWNDKVSDTTEGLNKNNNFDI